MMLKMHAMNVLPETVFTWSESTKRSFGLCLRPLSFPCMASNYSLSSCIALDSLSFQSSSRSGTNPYAGLTPAVGKYRCCECFLQKIHCHAFYAAFLSTLEFLLKISSDSQDFARIDPLRLLRKLALWAQTCARLRC